jgi:predicted nucleotidyltransferase
MIDFNTVQNVISHLAEEYKIKNVFCFGSYADGSQKEDSDVDFLVEFITPSISLISLSRLKQKLEEQLGLSVDLVHAPVPPESILIINIRF